MVGDTTVRGKDPIRKCPAIPYTFCDVYRFTGDTVAELTAFVIRTDRSNQAERTANDADAMAAHRHN